jgi:hypothetical protein
LIRVQMQYRLEEMAYDDEDGDAQRLALPLERRQLAVPLPVWHAHVKGPRQLGDE